VTDGILDSHHHLWDTGDVDYELFRADPALAGAFRAEDYDAEASACGVTFSICVEAASAGADGRLETEWLSREAQASALVIGVVAWAPLERPNELEPQLDWLLGLGGKPIVGVRRSFEFEDPGFASRAEVAAGARAAGERGLVVDLVLFSPSLGAVVQLVDACPDTQFVLDHLGKPRIRERVSDPWRSELREVALRPNVVCKVSGLPAEADPASWTVSDLSPYVEHALDCFGTERLLYGSDWPLTERAGGQRRWLDAVRQLIGGLGTDQQLGILGTNARRIYGVS
jgi:L-fuconolactonase